MPRRLVVLRTDLDGEELNKIALATVHNSVGARMHPRKVGIPMRTSVKFVSVCAGAPIVALFVGGATAWATPSTSADSSGATSTEQTTTGGLAVSAGGNNLVKIGSSTATTSGRSLAVAFDLPNAGASTATAKGNSSFALAIDGSTATANGDGNFAFAGMDSTAIANGNNNDVRAAFGSTNRVTGNDNTSYAIPHSDAEVKGDNNFAVSLCGGSVTISGQGQQVTKAPCVGVNLTEADDAP